METVGIVMIQSSVSLTPVIVGLAYGSLPEIVQDGVMTRGSRRGRVDFYIQHRVVNYVVAMDKRLLSPSLPLQRPCYSLTLLLCFFLHANISTPVQHAVPAPPPL